MYIYFIYSIRHARGGVWDGARAPTGQELREGASAASEDPDALTDSHKAAPLRGAAAVYQTKYVI